MFKLPKKTKSNPASLTRGGAAAVHTRRLPVNMANAQSSSAVSGNAVKQKHMDSAFLIIILVLVTYGVVMVFSASYAAALNETGNSLHYISKHIVFVIGGIAAMILASYVDYHVYRRLVFWILAGAGVLMVAVPFIGTDHGTFAKRWIDIGGFTFQPSEVMKFAMIVLFAHLVASNIKNMGSFRYGVLPFTICLGTVAGLMALQPHLSGIIIMFAIGFVMMFVGGTKLRYFLAVGLIAAALIGAIFVFKGSAYVMERLTLWLDPFADPTNSGWQTVQSLVAIGSGGIMGRGIGMSRQKYMYLPEPQNDFIFAIICEELGLIGAVLVIILFLLFALRGFSIASKAPDKFGYMLGVGLTAQICIQTVLNIAVVTNTIPNTGISLPFFSYGGTAILMQLGQMGILLNISRQATMEKT